MPMSNAIEHQIGENLDLSCPLTELEELFQTNGYDLFIDPFSWLQLHHPESLPEPI